MEPTDMKFAVRPWNLRLALAVAVIPTIAYVLHDLVFQLPDNAHEPTLGFFLTVAGLLGVWASSGYIIARRVNGTRSRIIAGAVVGIVSVGILWLTSIALNNLFVDRMSYEPDRIRAFQQSGYATMKEYLHHQGWGPAPLLMFVAAIVGAIGGAVRKRTERMTT
jgi:hypothetical protein